MPQLCKSDSEAVDLFAVIAVSTVLYTYPNIATFSWLIWFILSELYSNPHNTWIYIHTINKSIWIRSTWCAQRSLILSSQYNTFRQNNYVCTDWKNKLKYLSSSIVSWRILRSKQQKIRMSFNYLLCFWNKQFPIIIKYLCNKKYSMTISPYYTILWSYPQALACFSHICLEG